MQAGRTIVQALLILTLLFVPPMMHLQGIGQMHSSLSDAAFNRVVKTGMCPPNVNGGNKEYPCTVREYIDRRVFGGWAAIGELVTSYGIWFGAAGVWLALASKAFDPNPIYPRVNTKFYDGRRGASPPPS